MSDAERPSKTVDRQNLPEIAARERVAAILRVHDVYDSDRDVAELTEGDYAVVRIIAQEAAFANTDPALRYKAISALARVLLVENVNLLSDLARFGEDFYIRGHALLALGQTGMYAFLPILLERLDAKERFERSAAARAVTRLAELSSLDGVRAHAVAIGGTKLRERLDGVLEEHLRAVRARPAERRETSSGRPEKPR